MKDMSNSATSLDCFSISGFISDGYFRPAAHLNTNEGIRFLDHPGKMKRLIHLIVIKQNNTKATATADDKCTLKRPVIQFALRTTGDQSIRRSI